jgi:hypothetical protein
MFKKAILFFYLVQLAWSYPGETTELGWTTKQSIREVLDQFGYKGMTVIDGVKVEDNSGYSITADCVRGNDRYTAKVWVSIDWSEGRVVSVISRKTNEPAQKSIQSEGGEKAVSGNTSEVVLSLIMSAAVLLFIYKVMKW